MTFEEIVKIKERRAEEKGREEGREEGQQDLLNSLIEKGLITSEQAIEYGYVQPQAEK